MKQRKNKQQLGKKKAQVKSNVPRQLLQVKLGMGFPRFMDCIHRYVEEFPLTSTTGVMANYRFRCNGMFDPNHTATGHQPAYFDTLSSIYDQWVVTECNIKLTAIPTPAVTNPFAFGIAINDDVTTSNTNFFNYYESDSCVLNYVAFNNTDPKTLSLTWKVRSSFPGNPYGNDSLIGSTSADPLEQQYFNVFLQAIDQTSTALFLGVAELHYTARWFELKDLVPS